LFGGRDLLGLGAIALMAAGGAALVDRVIDSELEIVRGVRVSLDARRALEQRSRPPGVGGELSIVRSEDGALVFVVNTASVSRAGRALSAGAEDEARAARHRAAIEKRSIREPLGGGVWRATAADAAMSAELVSEPPEIPRASPVLGALVAFLAGAVLAGVARLRLGPAIAAALGLTAAAALSAFFAASSVELASQAAVSYLSESTASPPAVSLRPAPALLWLAGLFVLELAAVFALGRRRGAAR